MGICRDDSTQQIQPRKLGGNRAVLFVYAMQGLENMAFVSNAMSLVVYFYGFMNLSLTKSATTLTNWMGTSFLLALFGGFISDTYLSRFRTTVLFGCIEVVGYALLTAQAHFTHLRPFPCKNVPPGNQCEVADNGQLALLFAGLYLVALGTGGVKGGLPSLGADQFDENDPKEKVQLSSYFNWFLFSLTIGAVIGVIFLVWISTNQGWDLAFGICAVAVFFGFSFLCMGKSFYRNNNPSGSPITRILQVFVAAIRNRNLPVPASTDELHELYDKEAGMGNEILRRSEQFRFLDRAAITMNAQGTSLPNKTGSWHLCSVTQVEETKILIRMLPIIISTIFMNTCLAQLQTFSVQQSLTMDTNLFGFHVPAASLPVIPLVIMAFLVPIYERFFVPIVRKFTGIPTGIRHLQRIGVGLVLSAISMAISGYMETRRKSVAIEHNMVDSMEPLPMSVFWLGFQYAVFGAADLFTLVGILEFFYAESSEGMKALSTAISWSSLAFGYFLSSVVVEVVNNVSGGWLASNNLNRDKLNYFYYLLAGLSVINFGFYLCCASWYRYKKVEEVKQDSSSEKGEVSMTKITG